MPFNKAKLQETVNELNNCVIALSARTRTQHATMLCTHIYLIVLSKQNVHYLAMP